MHIYFLAIGGAGIGPLAQISSQAGHEVSGSDIQNSSYIDDLKKSGITDIQITDDKRTIEEVNNKKKIDWLVYSSAVAMNDKGLAQLELARSLDIRCTKRDEFIREFVESNNLKMIAVAGTHGKTTTVAMLVWLLKNKNIPISYLLAAKVSFGDMAEYNKSSEYFIYEADEFDRNFLSFYPELSLISGVSYDHHEIYKTRQDYKDAFKQFINQSSKAVMWQSDCAYLDLNDPQAIVLNEADQKIDSIKLKGKYNRYDGFLAVSSLCSSFDLEQEDLINVLNNFPGLSRRMEEITANLYSDYAHTPEKIKAAISAAKEVAGDRKLIVIYEPLTNRRQIFVKDEYKDSFNGADHLYWLPSYLAREDPKDGLLSPKELISSLSDPRLAESADKNTDLINNIRQHLNKGDMVVGMAGGGGGSLDDWLRDNFSA